MANFSTILSNGLALHLQGYLFGLTLSTAGASTTFSVAAGVAVDDVPKDFMKLGASISKTTSAWAVGSGNGGIDTGAVAASTWYHAYLIKRPDTGVVDVLFSLSATAPTMPTNYTLKRRIGSMKTNGSSQWTSFTQVNDIFIWSVVNADFSGASTAARVTQALASIPTGIIVKALLRAGLNNVTAGLFTLVCALTEADVSPTQSDAILSTAVSGSLENVQVEVLTNTSAQVAVRSSAAAAATVNIGTFGWIDDRGKLS